MIDGVHISILTAAIAGFAVFSRLDFSRFTLQSPDSLYMLSTGFVFSLLLLGLCFMSLVRSSDRYSQVIPFVLAFLFLVLYPTNQGASVRYWDTFYHESYVETIVRTGGIPTHSGSAWQPYFEYPGAFLALSIAQEITSIPLINIGYTMSAVSNILLVAVILLLGRKAIGRMGYLCPLLFLVVSPYMDLYAHFCPQVYVLPLYVLSLYLVFTETKDRRMLGIMSVLALGTVISSPTTMVFLIASIWGVSIVFQFLGDRNRSTPRFFAILLVVIWGVYLIWYAYQNFGDMIQWSAGIFAHETGSLRETFIGNTNVEGFVQELIVAYTKLAPIATLTLGFASALTHWRDRKIQMLSVIAVASMTPAIAGFFFGRVEIYVLIPLCIMGPYIIRSWRRSRTTVFGVAVVALIVVSFFAFHTWEYVRFIHPWEQESAEFVVQFSSGSSIGTDRYTLMVLDYYRSATSREWLAYGILFYDNVGQKSLNFTQTLQENPFLFDGQVIVRSYRQDLLTNYYYKSLDLKYNWGLVDHNLETADHNLVYSNGFTSVYGSSVG